MLYTKIKVVFYLSKIFFDCFPFLSYLCLRMDRNKYLVALAGGSGTRMGGGLPKQFIELDGVPILQRSIEAFTDACPGIHVITVLPDGMTGVWKDLCTRHGFDIPQRLVTGGITRFHSVRNALMAVPDGCLVAIHDAARPLVSPEMIQRMFGKFSLPGTEGGGRFESSDMAEGARVEGGGRHVRALIPVVPCTDTLKAVTMGEDGELAAQDGEDPDRTRIYAAQTPQIFLSEDIKAAYGQAYDLRFTDDASVARSFGIPLDYTPGERFNLKITTREDLSLASLLLGLKK